MSLRDHGASTGDPLAADPFSHDPFDDAPPLPAYPSPTQPHPIPASGPPAPPGEVNTLATLSVVFAFAFAPAGAVLGHLALSQIKRLKQRGRRRAVLGLTLSYFFVLLAAVVLIVWLLVDVSRGKAGPAASTPPPAPSIRSTVITPPPHGRPKVSVAELRVGDCVEIQKNEPDPTRPNTDQIYIYRARCEVRDGVFQVTQKSSSPDQCSRGEYLTNDEQTIVACFVKFGSASISS